MNTPTILTSERPAPVRRHAVGHAMAIGAGVLFGVTGSVSKVVLESGVSSLRLTEVRCTGAVVGLFLVIVILRPRALRTNARELVGLALYGIFGITIAPLLLYLAISRLDVGIAILFQGLGPLFVALFSHFVLKRAVSRSFWFMLLVVVVGMSLVIDVWHGVSLDALGLLFALGSAAAVAATLLLSERGVATRDPLSLLFFGFVFAAILWAIVQPWWTFPYETSGSVVSLRGDLAFAYVPVWSLMLWIIVAGTIAPFALAAGAMRHIVATRAGLLVMVEPIVASVLAYFWLGETLGPIQIAGSIVVVAGLILVQLLPAGAAPRDATTKPPARRAITRYARRGGHPDQQT